MGLLAVAEPFAAPRPDGFLVTFKRGDLVDESHPIVATHRHLMVPAEPTVKEWPAPKVEQATAAPGERRTRTRPAKDVT